MAAGESKPNYTSTFLCNACIMFTKFLLTKAIVKGILEPEREGLQGKNGGHSRSQMTKVPANGTPWSWATEDTVALPRSM